MDAASRALFEALWKKASVADVKKLINPSTAKAHDSYYGMSPLLWALSHGHPFEVISKLVEANPAAVNEKYEPEGYTPLHYVDTIDAPSLKLLIEKCPAAAGEKDEQGMVPLHWAAEHNVSPEHVKLLMVANKKAATMKDNFGRIPYEVALENEASSELVDIISGAGKTKMLPVAIVFPNQGTMYTKFFKLCEGMPKVKELLGEAKNILGYDLVTIVGEKEKIAKGIYAQPASYVANIAAFEYLSEQNPDEALCCQSFAGVSVGELSALAAAGVFSFGDGLRLVKARAEAMEEASNLQGSAMCSAIGLTELEVREICQNAVNETGPNECCTLSHVMFEKGCAVAGTVAAVQACEKLMKAAKGFKVGLVKGAAGVHSPIMEPARQKFAKVVEEILPKMEPPKCKVFMNATGRCVGPDTDTNKIAELIVEQLTNPVRWTNCMENMKRDHIDTIYECGAVTNLGNILKNCEQDVFTKHQTFFATAVSC